MPLAYLGYNGIFQTRNETVSQIIHGVFPADDFTVYARSIYFLGRTVGSEHKNGN